jgi:hypothetical protein
MDGGVIARLKRRYRKHLLRRMIDKEYTSVDAFKKDLNVYEAIILVSAAWAEEAQEETQSVWQRCLGVGGSDDQESRRIHGPSRPGAWCEEKRLERDIDDLIGTLTNLKVEGIDPEATGSDWVSVDDLIGEDGGPLALDFDQLLDLLEADEDKEWEEPSAEGPDVLDDEEDPDPSASSEPSIDGRAMTYDEAMRAARKLASFLMDVGPHQKDLEMAAALNSLAVRLHDLQISSREQSMITDHFFPPQQTHVTDFPSDVSADV